MKRKNSIVFLIFILLGIVLSIPLKTEFNPVKSSELSMNLPSYTLSSTPETNYKKYPIYYPPVSVIPGSLKYRLLEFYEEYQILVNQNEPLFFSSKRINEIVTWKDTLPVKEEHKSTVGWTAILKRYVSLVEKQIHIADSSYDEAVRREKREEIKRHIVQHKAKLEEAIKTGTLSPTDKDIASALIHTVFGLYEKKLAIQKDTTGAYYSYPLTAVKINEDFGIFTAIIDANDLPFRDNPPQLRIGTSQYKANFMSLNPSSALYEFNSITIDGSVGTQLQLDKIKKTFDIPLQHIPVEGNDAQYAYADITEILPSGESEVRVDGKNINNLMIWETEERISSPAALLQAINAHNTSPSVTGNEQLRIVKDYRTTRKNYFLIVTDFIHANLTKEVMLPVEIVAVTSPKIILQKTTHAKVPVIFDKKEGGKHIVQLKNVSLGQRNQYVSLQGGYVLTKTNKIDAATYQLTFNRKNYASLSVPLMLLGIIGLFTQPQKLLQLFRSKHSKRIHSVLVWAFVATARIMKLIHAHVRIILILSVMYFLFEVFLLRRTIDFFVFTVCILLFLISLGKKTANILFLSTVIVSIMTIGLFIARNEAFRITADWVFVLLFFFVLQRLIGKTSD